MNKNYDIAIVGAGPAGSTTAYYAAKYGMKVAMFEKDREIGIPVRCGEAVSEISLQKYLDIDIDPQWIASEIMNFRLISPTQKIVDLPSPSKGFILHRRIFDNALAEAATRQGAEVYTKSYVYGLNRNNGETELLVKQFGKEVRVKAKLVIAADGVESRVARFAGIDTKLNLVDIEACMQMQVGNVEVEDKRCDFWVSEKWAPGGYVWVFPKGEGIANIGLGINGKFAGKRNALAYLQSFMRQFYPKATPLTTVAGGVPVSKYLSKLVTDGMMVVGDAARQVNPISGGGIAAALAAAKIAGQIAAKAVHKGDVSRKGLIEYEKKWGKTVGRNYNRFYKIKRSILNLEDQDFDNIANEYQGMRPEDITILKIFKEAIKNKRSLLLDLIKVFAGS